VVEARRGRAAPLDRDRRSWLCHLSDQVPELQLPATRKASRPVEGVVANQRPFHCWSAACLCLESLPEPLHRAKVSLAPGGPLEMWTSLSACSANGRLHQPETEDNLTAPLHIRACSRTLHSLADPQQKLATTLCFIVMKGLF